jgi:hypothetical protein
MKTKKKPKIRTVWHVYMDEDYRRTVQNYVYYDDIPFADDFGKMRLFRTKKAAMKYMWSMIDMIKGHLAAFRYNDTEPVYNEAVDGGEFVVGALAYSAGKKRKFVDAIRIKAVLRTVE